MPIHVTPQLDREEAEAILAPSKRPWLSRLFLKKPARPKRTELIHFPLFLFDVTLENKGTIRRIIISVDGLLGEAALFDRSGLKTESRTGAIVCQPILSRDEATKCAVHHARGVVLEHGLKMKTSFEIKATAYREQIFYPFWVGYFEKGGKYDIRIVDAVRGDLQGARMRKVCLAAIRHLEE